MATSFCFQSTMRSYRALLLHSWTAQAIVAAAQLWCLLTDKEVRFVFNNTELWLLLLHSLHSQLYVEEGHQFYDVSSFFVKRNDWLLLLLVEKIQLAFHHTTVHFPKTKLLFIRTHIPRNNVNSILKKNSDWIRYDRIYALHL